MTTMTATERPFEVRRTDTGETVKTVIAENAYDAVATVSRMTGWPTSALYATCRAT